MKTEIPAQIRLTCDGCGTLIGKDGVLDEKLCKKAGVMLIVWTDDSLGKDRQQKSLPLDLCDSCLEQVIHIHMHEECRGKM